MRAPRPSLPTPLACAPHTASQAGSREQVERLEWKLKEATEGSARLAADVEGLRAERTEAQLKVRRHEVSSTRRSGAGTLHTPCCFTVAHMGYMGYMGPSVHACRCVKAAC